MNYNIIFYLTGNNQVYISNGYRVGNIIVNSTYDADDLYTELIELIKSSKLVTIIPPQKELPIITLNTHHIIKFDFITN